MILSIPSITVIISGLFEKKENLKHEYALGEIFGVQSKNTFLVKLFSNRKITIKIFDFVEFIYSIDEKRTVRKDLVLDTYLLNEQQWIKVLTTSEITQIFGNKDSYENHIDDIVYKIEEVPDTKYLNTFMGIVTENSTIEKIKFIYNSKNSIKEGYLLEVKIGINAIYYQVIEGITKIEQLENKNETGLIIGEAIQLGTWEKEKAKFDPFGWVPDTNIPVIINKFFALTHHTAIIGITGSGKSVFSRNLVREYLKDENVKVICIDFTGEYKDKFSNLNPVEIIDNTMADEIFKEINANEVIISNNYNRETNETKKKKQEISIKLISQITLFLKNAEQRITIMDLPEVINTSEIFEYMRLFIKSLFYLAKKKSFGNKICLVLEEALTIIPEWNFAGISVSVKLSGENVPGKKFFPVFG